MWIKIIFIGLIFVQIVQSHCLCHKCMAARVLLVASHFSFKMKTYCFHTCMAAHFRIISGFVGRGLTSDSIIFNVNLPNILVTILNEKVHQTLNNCFFCQLNQKEILQYFPLLGSVSYQIITPLYPGNPVYTSKSRFVPVFLSISQFFPVFPTVPVKTSFSWEKPQPC